MNLKHLVIFVSVLHTLIDVAGVIITIYFDQILQLVQHEDSGPRLYEDVTAAGDDILHTDFSVIRNINILFYTLPYLFSGVIPRMLNGLECLTADQVVSNYLIEWRQIMGLREDFTRALSELPEDYWRGVLNHTIENLEIALEKRRDQCRDSNFTFQDFSDRPKKSQYLKDFEERLESKQNYKSVILMKNLEMITMAANAAASVLLGVLACSPCQLPVLYMPWLLLTAFEIAGNLCVVVVFSVVPGYCHLTCLICLVKVVWLGTTWAKAVRRSMVIGLPANPGQDDERRMLRSQLSFKGRQRFGRIFGSYQ